MSVLSVQNIQETFVGKNIARTGSIQITNPNATGYIADGEVVVVNSSGAVGTTATTTYALSPWIQIVQRSGDNLIWSPRIFGNRVTGYRGKVYTAGQEQIYHIGYNGSANSLDITAGLDYQLTVIENQDDMMWSEQKKKNVVNVPNNLVVTQMDLAKAIVKNQMKKYNTDGSSITAAMLNSGSGTVVAGGVTLNVVHGSNVIVFSGSAAGVSAGVILRIGTTGSAIGTTIPVYTVTGSGPVANSFYLDQPYAGPSNTALPNADSGIVAAGANWGVRFTGKQLPYRRDFFKFKRVGFTLQMSGFGSTILTKTQEAAYGSGDGRLVLEEESFTKGFEGALNRMTVPLPLANEIFMADATVSSTVGATGNATITASTAYTTTGQFATFTTSAAHGFVVGQSVQISGITTPAIGNPVTATIVAVPSPTTFTIPSTVAAASGNTNAGNGTVAPQTTGANGDTFPTSNGNYSMITLEYFNQDTATVVQPPIMPQLVKIAMPVGAGQGVGTGTTNAVQNVLNTWTNGTPGAFANLTVM